AEDLMVTLRLKVAVGYEVRFERRLGDEIQELKSKIKLQGEKIRALKSLKTDQDTEVAEIATLLDKQIHSENSKELYYLIRKFDYDIKHGAVTIDTPVSELKEILSGKYGKLIYDLDDQGFTSLVDTERPRLNVRIALPEFNVPEFDLRALMVLGLPCLRNKGTL
ncbi:31591_t:CDS:2, partial [Gigaspora margarita]